MQPIAIVEVGLALGDVLGDEEVEQRHEALVERLELAPWPTYSTIRVVAPGQRAQLRHPVRVRQEAHVEHDVGVARQAVLVAEATSNVTASLASCLARQELVDDPAPQRRGADPARVETRSARALSGSSASRSAAMPCATEPVGLSG